MYVINGTILLTFSQTTDFKKIETNDDNSKLDENSRKFTKGVENTR